MARDKRAQHLDPDEIFLDSGNLPSFDQSRLEGRIERALSTRAVYILSGLFLLAGLVFIGRLAELQIVNGQNYSLRSEDNSLRMVSVPSERGVIRDRNGLLLAWNDPEIGRQYIDKSGFGHLLGYLGYPQEGEVSNVIDSKARIGKMGVEKYFDNHLRGSWGLRIEEVDVSGRVVSENMESLASDGAPLELAIDSRLQTKLYEYISDVAKERGFTGGAGVVMDVETGEIIALVSYPGFSSALLSSTTTQPEISQLLVDKNTPFLNRATSGLYAPGSIIKPVIAVAALSEDVIDSSTKIISTGSIEVPNPYSPGNPSIFKDWKAHGAVDMREALAVSSNVYFYAVGGGYKGQKGVGIEAINNYARLFGLGEETGINLPGEEAGVVPSVVWKKETFGDDPWRVGDTYHTAIGQYGFQVTPIQMARTAGAVATGKLVTPSVIKSDGDVKTIELGISERILDVVREGMRLAVTSGTAKALDVSYVKFGGKTGTAELGSTKSRVNSWIEGFFPFDQPKYSFAIVMERGAVGNTIGAASVANRFFEWMSIYTPEYFRYNGS